MQYVKVEVFIFLVLDYTGQLGSKKIHSLLIGCNNLITNLKVPGEFSQPKPTRFCQRFFAKVLNAMDGFSIPAVKCWSISMSSTYLLNDFLSQFLYCELRWNR